MASPREREALRAWLVEEYGKPFAGWDFSYLAGRRVTIRSPDTWDYTNAVLAAVDAGARSLLDIGTGGGGFLAGLPRRPPITWATEGYPPNVLIARRRLEPLGIPVAETADEGPLPFAGGQFDLVINRHAGYRPAEVRRILAPGGLFITQQVGGQANRTLHDLLEDGPPPGARNPASRRDAGWNLAGAVAELESAGFRILEQREDFPITRYFDAGAIVYYLKAVAWEIPDFSVDRYFDRLVALHRRIQAEGHVDVLFHTFFVRAKTSSTEASMRSASPAV